MVHARKYVLVKRFQGEPKKTDFQIDHEELPPIKDGEILTEAEFLSVDPYMRSFLNQAEVPLNMIGTQVARIIESKHPEYPVGKKVVGQFGWRDLTVINPDTFQSDIPLSLLPDFGQLPSSLALGALGMPGNTAYFGFLEICKPKAGETVVVTGAAGAVGSHVGQIAKNLGCKVIGFAGSDVKCNYLTKELGFDHAFNYKKVNITAALREAAPNGVECYFDNVGGDISTAILNCMNKFGRVSVCGSISSYNDDFSTLPKATLIQPSLVFKELTLEGFLVAKRWRDRWNEGIEANLKWIQEGKLKYREEIWDGFDNMTDAFLGLLRGENTGKAIVKV